MIFYALLIFSWFFLSVSQDTSVIIYSVTCAYIPWKMLHKYLTFGLHLFILQFNIVELYNAHHYCLD